MVIHFSAPLSDIVLGGQMLFGFIYAAFMAIITISIGDFVARIQLIDLSIFPFVTWDVPSCKRQLAWSLVPTFNRNHQTGAEGLDGGKVQPVGPVRGEI
ncbi:MAG: hypothetical protein IPJ47_16660 [Anaerolineales bacterium]|nr:hypothetical protein [Anaerolineales bacterium]